MFQRFFDDVMGKVFAWVDRWFYPRSSQSKVMKTVFRCHSSKQVELRSKSEDRRVACSSGTAYM